MNSREAAYTAANSFPVKLLRHEQFLRCIHRSKLRPFHVQFNPTNRCNLKCAFCSCHADDRKTEMPVAQIEEYAARFRALGCLAATITGGGEPLLHADPAAMFWAFINQAIEVGFVTNGLLLDRLPTETLRQITWCRISCSDERDLGDQRLHDPIQIAVRRAPGVDWAFSYVVTPDFHPDGLCQFINFANEHHFTHIRVVTDMSNLETVPDMDEVRKAVRAGAIDDSLVLYQQRTGFEPGVKECWISLLKPVVGADGRLFPCCGTQYARKEQDWCYSDTMCMGAAEDLEGLYDRGVPFDGSGCYRCYYGNYNRSIALMLQQVDHQNFI